MKQADRAILLTSYMTGSTEGNNLGTPGYSYDFVTQLFEPLLSRWGKVIPVCEPGKNLDAAAKQASSQGLRPIHLSFLPFQDVVLTEEAPNVVVPAWEFPDVPNEAFDGNLQNDWIQTAAKCDMILVGGQFTVDAFRRGGITQPIRIVPVPTPDDYFELPLWQPTDQSSLDFDAVVFDRDAEQPLQQPHLNKGPSSLKTLTKSYERAFRDTTKLVLGDRYEKLSESIKARRVQKRTVKSTRSAPIKLLFDSVDKLELSGVVYTSIFNPDDGRKNWKDLLTAFLAALGDKEDVTLVLKLITSRAVSIERMIHQYQCQGMAQKCKIAFVYGFLDDEQMLSLAKASTFYYQTTRAEGNCLPLMNYLGAARPGVSPDHSAIGDYFNRDMGMVIDSHPEPAAWPQDPRWKIRTTWGRMAWPSIVEQLRDSYAAATANDGRYESMGYHARAKLQSWASIPAVEERLHAALDETYDVAYANNVSSPQAVRFRAAA